MAAVKPCRHCGQMPPPVPGKVERPKPWVPEEGEFVLVSGITRMGKSTWLKELCAYLMKQGIAVICWDPAREYSVHGIEREKTPLGPLLTQVTVTELEEQAAAGDGTPTVLCAIEKGASAPAVSIVPDELKPTRAQVAEDFVRALRAVQQHRPDQMVVLLIDECGLLEGNKAAEEQVEEITFSWGKDGFGAFLATQCTALVPDRARRNCRKVIGFRQIDDNDLAALTRLVGPRFRREVEKLAPHQCLLANRMERHLWREDAPDETGAEHAA